MAEATVVDDNVVRSLQARWGFVNGKLQAAYESSNLDEIEVFSRKLDKLKTEATERGLNPDRLGMTSDDRPEPAPSESEKGTKKSSKAAISKPQGRKVAIARETAKRVKLHKSKGTPKLLPCLCGCGESVEGDFARGHNKNLLAIINRIESGKGKLKDIPKVAEPYTKFAKRNNKLVCVTAPVYVGPGINMVARTKR